MQFEEQDGLAVIAACEDGGADERVFGVQELVVRWVELDEGRIVSYSGEKVWEKSELTFEPSA
jgi:hypothetical protein